MLLLDLLTAHTLQFLQSLVPLFSLSNRNTDLGHLAWVTSDLKSARSTLLMR